LGREVTEDVYEVSSPESTNTLLRSNTGETVCDTGVTWDFTRDNTWVSILGLNDELYTLDRSSAGLCYSTRDATSSETFKKILY
jgi:hypothetical protein